MSLKHQFEFDPKDPFGNDKLQREEEAVTLTNLVKNYADGFVLAINNEWGAGKTTFLQMWQAHLKLQGVESLYFNAWENDHQTDVLVALLSELKELKNTEKEKFKSVVKKAAPIATSVLTSSIKALAKTVGADGIVQAFIDAAAEGGEKLLHTEIGTYTARKEGLKEFQKSLEEYASAVGGENPLVFVIDELDRCRPSYAVEVLEQIKHVFSVPGIVFVLAIDKVQLGHAIKGVYGSPGMDDVEYLRRFIDVEFALPKPDPKNYTDYLYSNYGFETLLVPVHKRQYSDNFGRNVRDFLHYFTLYFQLTLRQVERLCARLKIIFSVYPIAQDLGPTIYMILAIIRMKKYDLYQTIVSCEIGEQELIDELAKLIPTDMDSRDGGIMIFTLSYAYNNELRYHKSDTPQLVKEKDGIKKLRLFYGHFSTNESNDISYLERLRGHHSLYDLRIGHIISNIEFSRKYFNE